MLSLFKEIYFFPVTFLDGAGSSVTDHLFYRTVESGAYDILTQFKITIIVNFPFCHQPQRYNHTYNVLEEDE